MLDIATLAAWGEFIGGIAVVVSLLYLASQIRQNSKLLRASTTAMVSDNGNAVSALVAQHPDTARVFWAGLADRSALSEEDRQRFDPLISMYINSMAHEYHLWKDGAVSSAIWENRRLSLRNVMGTGVGVQQFWSDWEHGWDEEFRAFVNELIDEIRSGD